jgi:hypothetical protein
MARCPDAGPSLALLQVGVGVAVGSSCVVPVVQAGMEAEPGCITAKVDFSNAFNLRSRKKLKHPCLRGPCRCCRLVRTVHWANLQGPHRELEDRLAGAVRSILQCPWVLDSRQ